MCSTYAIYVIYTTSPWSLHDRPREIQKAVAQYDTAIKRVRATRWCSGKNPNASAGDVVNAGPIWLNDPWVGNGNSLQYSLFENYG